MINNTIDGSLFKYKIVGNELHNIFDDGTFIILQRERKLPGWHYDELRLENPYTKNQAEIRNKFIGEWYVQHSPNEIPSGLQSAVFKADGTAQLTYTFYGALWDDGYADIEAGKWRIVDDYLLLDIYGDGRFFDRFEIKGDELYRYSFNNRRISRTTVYESIYPLFPDYHYTELNEQRTIQAANSALKRQFVGKWHYDIIEWHFNEDGTGYMDIPAFGMHEGAVRKFTYEVFYSTISDATLVYHWYDENGRYEGYEVRQVVFGTRSGGSATIVAAKSSRAETYLLTRQFDFNNTPFLDNVVEQGMALLNTISMLANPLGALGGGGVGGGSGSVDFAIFEFEMEFFMFN